MKSGIKIDWLDLSTIFFFYIFAWLLALGLSGYFSSYLVAAGLMFFVVAAYLARNIISFVCDSYWVKYLLIFLATIIIFSGCLMLNGGFSGDAINYWLPLAREIVRQSIVPDLLLNNQTFLTSRPPFFSLLSAATFSFIGFKELAVFWIPIVFSFFTIVVLLKWWRLKEAPSFFFWFLPVLFLANPLVLSYGWNLLQEPIAMFFFTAFFYYLEKYQKERSQQDLWLISLCFILAIASKETGLLLSVPLAIFIIRQNLWREAKIGIFILPALPIFFWWTRNYLIYGNPVFPLFNNLFEGKFYLIQNANNFYTYPIKSFFERFNLEVSAQFLPLAVLALVSLYIFFKEKKWEYLSVILLMCALGQFWSLIPFNNIRYYYPFFGLIFFYFVYGLAKIKSPKFLSLAFFVSLLVLLSSPIVFAGSDFIMAVEKHFAFLGGLVQFIWEQRLWLVLLLSALFYYFVSKEAKTKYFIFLIVGLYSFGTPFSHLSWLNIWGPILILLVSFFFWKYWAKIKESRLVMIICVSVMFLLILNTWLLNIVYFGHNGYWPYLRGEGLKILFEAGDKIRKLEGSSNNFYVLSDQPKFLIWYYDLKDIDSCAYTFLLLTDLKYRDQLSAVATRDLLREIGVKYLFKSTHKNYWDNFFNKIGSNPDLFEPIIKHDGYVLWRMK